MTTVCSEHWVRIGIEETASDLYLVSVIQIPHVHLCVHY